MQNESEQQQYPLLLGADVAIPEGWRSLVIEIAQELTKLSLPTSYRIEKVFRIDEHMYVYSNSECLSDTESDLRNRVYEIINAHCQKASCACMSCGRLGKTLFETDQWGVFCDQHIPSGALDLYARFEQIPLENLDRTALYAEFPDLPSLELRPGWLPLIKFLMQELTAVGFNSAHYRILQVKEKFASLAFYVYSTDPDLKRQKLVNALIDAARNRSTTMCEVCGERGSLWIHAGWWSTACPQHVPSGAKTPAEYWGKSGG